MRSLIVAPNDRRRAKKQLFSLRSVQNSNFVGNGVTWRHSHIPGEEMKRLLAASLLAMAMPPCAGADQAPESQPAGRAPAGAVRDALADDAIKRAVREILAETPGNREQAGPEALSADKYEHFSRSFSNAKIPDCLRPDGLKYQSTLIFSGILAAPFIAVAKLRGKCL